MGQSYSTITKLSVTNF